MRKVLIVEDYEDTRLFMKFLVESYGYQVIEAVDGYQAIKRVKYPFPDLILMDMAMPIMDGIDATKVIRTFEQGADIPIIAVTAHGKQFYEEAIEAGCNDLIAKPVDFVSLKQILNKYLGH